MSKYQRNAYFCCYADGGLLGLALREIGTVLCPFCLPDVDKNEAATGYPRIHYAIDHSGSVAIGDTQSPHCQMGERQRPLDDVRNGGP